MAVLSIWGPIASSVYSVFVFGRNYSDTKVIAFAGLPFAFRNSENPFGGANSAGQVDRLMCFLLTTPSFMPFEPRPDGEAQRMCGRQKNIY